MANDPGMQLRQEASNEDEEGADVVAKASRKDEDNEYSIFGYRQFEGKY